MYVGKCVIVCVGGDFFVANDVGEEVSAISVCGCMYVCVCV